MFKKRKLGNHINDDLLHGLKKRGENVRDETAKNSVPKNGRIEKIKERGRRAGRWLSTNLPAKTK